MLEEAQKHLALATRLSARGTLRVGGSNAADREERRARMLSALAQARFLAAEATCEEFLAVTLPQGLAIDDWHRRARSKGRYKQWLEAKAAALSRSLAQYQGVLSVREHAWTIAALARVG